MQDVRIGVDIGGTFTDFVVERGPERASFKRLTTPEAPEQAVLAGLDHAIATLGISPADIAAFIHGTTLATNAVIERRGARVGFVTTEGFRDTLEMAYEDRYDQYDLLIDRTKPLVERRLRFAVAERVTADGRVLTPLDRAALAGIAESLRATEVEAVAIGFLHSYAWPDHETAAAEILAAALPGVTVCRSSDVSPEIREYDRFSTVVANAYIRPLMQTYLAGLADGLRARSVAAPLLLIQSNGGLCDAATAMRYPVRLLESGPAGGAIFAAALARALDLPRALLLDVGGTTAKLCFIDDARPHMARAMEVGRVDRFKAGSGLPLRFPVVELSEIGAGGGSIARVDSLGRLQIGPRSAGSVPGPACYALGGTEATVTDANLMLGRLDAEKFADGTIPLDPPRALAAIDTHVATPLGLDGVAAACGILAVVNENMANAAREHAIDSDTSLTGRVLIGIGGGAALHAADLAAALGIERVVIPRDAGVGSAVGFLRAPLAFERAVSHPRLLSRLDLADLCAAVDRLLARVTDDALATGHVHGSDLATTLSAQMRYRGQGSELTVLIARDRLDADDARAYLADSFERVYRAVYRRTMAGSDIEILAWTARSEAPLAAPPPPASLRPGRAMVAIEREVVDPKRGAPVAAAIWNRDDLGADAVVSGPALVTDPGTTIVVPAGWTATVSLGGHLLLNRDGARPMEHAA